MNYVTFDIETYSPSGSDRIDTNEFRASVVGAYFSWLDEYVAFMEEDVKDFLDILKHADLVVGYNHIWFDLPVLQKYSNFNLLELPNYDIMLEIEKKLGFKLKLNDVCKANLGEVKTDTYSQFKHYYSEGKWFELIDYCMHDVRLTQEIFQQILDTRKLFYFDLHQKREIILDEPKAGKAVLSEQPDSIF